MDTINPFEELVLPPNAAVGLKDGINISELTSGAMFEVDLSTVANEPKEQFDKEEILKNLDVSCSLGEDYSSSDDDLPPFKQLERSMNDLTGDKGVMKKVVQMGLGSVIPKGCVVRVHYNGYLEYADEPYDSTRLRSQPLKIRLGNQEVIPGLEIGVATMKKSEISRFLIRSDYAFGGMGCPPRIPPDATILFEVEVLSFIDSKAADDYHSLTDENRQRLTLNDIIDVAKSEKESFRLEDGLINEAGNEAFEMKHFGKAARHYSTGIRTLEPAHLNNDEEEERWSEILVKLYLNLALSNLKQCKSKLAITNCRRVLELDHKNTKATFRLGQAHMQLSEWEKSKRYLLMAVQLAPNNVEIRQELEKLDQKVQQFQLLEKNIYSKMFKDHQPEESKLKTKSLLTTGIDESVEEMFQQKLRAFKDNSDQKEIVLPSGTNQAEIDCLVQLAEKFKLNVELGNEKTCSYSVKIVKPRPEKLPVHYEY